MSESSQTGEQCEDGGLQLSPVGEDGGDGVKRGWCRLVTGDDDGYLVFWSMEKCLDDQYGADCLSYRSHNTYVVGNTSGLILVGECLLLSSSGRDGQVTTHDYWRAAVRDLDHTDSW